MTPLAVSTIGVILIVLALLLVLMAVGGYSAMGRRTRGREGKLSEGLRAAERGLAQAHALDKGWDRAIMESAARDAAAARFAGADVASLQLVQVVDRPGTDADQAVYRVETADGGEHRITLGRTNGVWGPA